MKDEKTKRLVDSIEAVRRDLKESLDCIQKLGDDEDPAHIEQLWRAKASLRSLTRLLDAEQPPLSRHDVLFMFHGIFSGTVEAIQQHVRSLQQLATLGQDMDPMVHAFITDGGGNANGRFLSLDQSAVLREFLGDPATFAHLLPLPPSRDCTDPMGNALNGPRPDELALVYQAMFANTNDTTFETSEFGKFEKQAKNLLDHPGDPGSIGKLNAQFRGLLATLSHDLNSCQLEAYRQACTNGKKPLCACDDPAPAARRHAAPASGSPSLDRARHIVGDTHDFY